MLNKYTEFSKDNPFGTQSKMLYHLDRLNEFITTGDTTPIFMEVSPTNRCNLKCNWCICSDRDSEELKLEYILKFIKQFAEFGGKAITFSGGGEPTLHPDFIEFSMFAKNHKLDLGLMTNGTFKESAIEVIRYCYNWIRISLDTVNPDLYLKLKGVDRLSVVLKNINLLKDSIKLGINCNVSSTTSLDSVKSIIDLLYNSCSYIQFRPVLPRYYLNEKPELNDEVWEYLNTLKNDPKINLSSDKFKDLDKMNLFPFKHCLGHVFSPVLTANGDVSVCMYHNNDKRFVFGNIKENDFEVIWKSENRKKIIDSLKNLNYNKECQVCCKLNELNKLLDFINNPDKNIDVNFL